MSKDKKKTLDCEVVRDLLPLYYDNVVSEKTATLIEEHIQECDECMRELESLKQAPKIEETQESKAKVDFKKVLKKLRRKGVVIGAVVVACVVAIFFAGKYLLTEAPIKEVSKDEFEAVHVYKFDYDRTDGSGYFFLLHYPISIMSGQTSFTHEVNGDTLEIEFKKALFTTWSDDNTNYTYEIYTIDSDEDYSSITINGNEVWNEETNEEAPEYVDYYNQFEHSDDVTGWSIYGDDTMGAELSNGDLLYWNIENGEVINLDVES
ncbi:MAG: zf-HC2 domain-containing protein [Ruminococcus sp.]|nr:zf-HC2 domain-containing protein [Ruminococcus sp.]